MIWIAVDAMGGDEAPGHVVEGALAAARRCDLGVAGIAIVGHGRSSAKAVRNAVAMAYRFASDRFIEPVEREIASATVGLRH